jgi:HAD superfamily hydrolase (TIGR01509 family)
MIAFMAELAKTYTIAIISNTNPLHYEYVLKKYPVWEPVAYFITSCNEGVRKPDIKIYQRLLEKSNASPHEVLMIDDIADNCRGARAAGFDAILFTGIENLRQDLLARDIIAFQSNYASS